MQSEEQREKRRKMKTTSEMWDTVKGTNICVMGVTQEERMKKSFEKIMAQNFPKLLKNLNQHIQESQ